MSFGRQHKYRAKPTTVDGIRFDSKAEAARWQELLLLQKYGAITSLERQVSYDLKAEGGQVVARYVADARYVENGQVIVEDCKGFLTPEYRIKRKWMLAQYGIEIREVNAKKKKR